MGLGLIIFLQIVSILLKSLQILISAHLLTAAAADTMVEAEEVIMAAAVEDTAVAVEEAVMVAAAMVVDTEEEDEVAVDPAAIAVVLPVEAFARSTGRRRIWPQSRRTSITSTLL